MYNHDMTIYDYINKNELDSFLDYIFREDFGIGIDITTDAVFAEDDSKRSAIVVSKDTGIIAGIELFSYIITKIDPYAEIKIILNDGKKVKVGDEILKVSTRITNLLRSERVCLNFLGRLCGIASITNKLVEEVKETKCKILDTRKTTPGIRFAEKYAVRVGGGTNHRMGLFDVVLIKDNHIDGAGCITECVERIRKAYGYKYKIIVETRTLDEVKEAVRLNIDRILLDNMTTNMIKEAVSIVSGKIQLESSGNITLKNVKEVALTGVDFISTSYITAWAQPLDLSLQIIK